MMFIYMCYMVSSSMRVIYMPSIVSRIHQWRRLQLHLGASWLFGSFFFDYATRNTFCTVCIISAQAMHAHRISLALSIFLLCVCVCVSIWVLLSIFPLQIHLVRNSMMVLYLFNKQQTRYAHILKILYVRHAPCSHCKFIYSFFNSTQLWYLSN